MRRESYEKQLVRQKIEAHRDLSRLELESLKAGNPLTSAFSLGSSVQSLLGGRGGGKSAAKATMIAAIPAVLYVLFKLWRGR